MLTAQPMFIISPAIPHCGACNRAHVTCHPVTPPIQNIVLHLLKNKQTTILAIINLQNIKETVSQVYSLSKATVRSCLPITNCQSTVFFLKSLHIIPPILAAIFPIIHLVMTCLFCKCSKNVLEFFGTFLELAGSKKY